MPKGLDTAAQRRVGMLLGMLSSEHDGEALNAARLAVRELAKAGLRPEDLVSLPAQASAGDDIWRNRALAAEAALHAAQQRQAASERASRSAPPPQDRHIPHAGNFASWLQDEATDLSAWEEIFLADLAEGGWERASPKQAAVLWRIHDNKVPSGKRKSA